METKENPAACGRPPGQFQEGSCQACSPNTFGDFAGQVRTLKARSRQGSAGVFLKDLSAFSTRVR